MPAGRSHASTSATRCGTLESRRARRWLPGRDLWRPVLRRLSPLPQLAEHENEDDSSDEPR